MNNLPQQEETTFTTSGGLITGSSRSKSFPDCLMPRNFPEAEKLAQYIANSDMVPKEYYKKPANVLIAMTLGGQVGLPYMMALQNITVINGRPCIWGDAMLALCKAHPACEYVEETFDEKEMKAICKVQRKGSPIHTATFSQKDAEQAGLWNKSGPWKQYPKRMLQCRARGFALRDTLPDALKGLNSAEEVRDYPAQPIKNMGSVETVTAQNGVTVIDPPEAITESPRDVSIDDIKKAMAKHDINIDKFYNHYEISRIEELEGNDLGKVLAKITARPLREKITLEL